MTDTQSKPCFAQACIRVLAISCAVLLWLASTSTLALERSSPLKASKPSPWVGKALNEASCRGKPTNFGPYDYRMRGHFDYELYLVESAHFNTYVEQLIRGANTTNELGWDLDYTLRAFPNHHRALYALIRYRMREGNYRHSVLAPPECYLQKALYFSPEDGTVHMLYGLLLHKLNRTDEALAHYRRAHELQPHDGQTSYNLGLLLVELGQYEEALTLAHQVYTRQFPLQGLKNKLVEKGAWREPVQAIKETESTP